MLAVYTGCEVVVARGIGRQIRDTYRAFSLIGKVDYDVTKVPFVYDQKLADAYN